MALNKGQLQSQITAAFITAMQTETGSVSATAAQLGQDIADAVDSFVKSGTVSTTVIGTLPPGPQAATGTGSVT